LFVQQVHGAGVKDIEFPKTEIQLYGYTGVVYSNYAYELETGGQHVNQSGRVTEVFVAQRPVGKSGLAYGQREIIIRSERTTRQQP
jgi:hypothetical protein